MNLCTLTGKALVNSLSRTSLSQSTIRHLHILTSTGESLAQDLRSSAKPKVTHKEPLLWQSQVLIEWARPSAKDYLDGICARL